MSNSAFVVLHADDRESEIVLVKTEYSKKLWSLPGGKIEQGEFPEDGASREVEEETGLEKFSEPFRIGELIPRKSSGLTFLYKATFYEGLKDHSSFNEDGEIEISDQITVNLESAEWEWFLKNVYRGQVALIAFYLFYNKFYSKSGVTLLKDYLSPPYITDPFSGLGIISPYVNKDMRIVPDCGSIGGDVTSSIFPIKK